VIWASANEPLSARPVSTRVEDEFQAELDRRARETLEAVTREDATAVGRSHDSLRALRADVVGRFRSVNKACKTATEDSRETATNRQEVLGEFFASWAKAEQEQRADFPTAIPVKDLGKKLAKRTLATLESDAEQTLRVMQTERNIQSDGRQVLLNKQAESMARHRTLQQRLGVRTPGDAKSSEPAPRGQKREREEVEAVEVDPAAQGNGSDDDEDDMEAGAE
jgi:hypothetical protein